MRRHGYGISSRKGSSLRAKSIPVQLSMFDQTISPDLVNAISSQGLAAGAEPCASLASPMTGLSGPDLALVSRSRSRGSARASPTTGTSGQSGASLSPSDSLQSFLESRLRALLPGSDLCEVIWKPWATPWGQSLSRPRARVRTISGTGSGLWVTIRASDGEKPLPAQAASIWPTPGCSNDRSPRPSEATRGKRADGSKVQVRLQGAAAATWPTPTSADGRRGTDPPRPHDTGIPLSQMASDSSGSRATTEKRGALNPEFVCWLMGYPSEWLSCAPSATPSTRGRRRHSSRQP